MDSSYTIDLANAFYLWLNSGDDAAVWQTLVVGSKLSLIKYKHRGTTGHLHLSVSAYIIPPRVKAPSFELDCKLV
jgi:hypothetical protein